MITVQPPVDSTPLIGDARALRERWEQDGFLFLRGVLDSELITWAREKYRGALASEGLIDLAIEPPIWTGKAPISRRPCDALGTTVWHEVVKQPVLNAVLRDIFEGEPVWIPIAAHRSGMPTGPLKEDEDIFFGRHQDGFFNEGIQFATCWLPIRDLELNSGSFVVAPGTHKKGNLHSSIRDENKVDREAIPDSAWRGTDYKVGDVLIFHHLTAHAALPNPSNEIRMSLDVRAIPDWAPKPVFGTVESVIGTDVTIRTDDGPLVTVHVDDETFIREINPKPRYPTSELQKIAYPGARVIAMTREDGRATVLRRNSY